MTPPTTRPMFKPDVPVQAEVPGKSPAKEIGNGLPVPVGGVAPTNSPVTALAIAFADEVVKNAKNPFLNKLPEIQPTTDPTAEGMAGAQAEAPPPPVDPFEGVKLSGIVYNPKTPIALLAFSSDNTQFAKRGDVVTGDKGLLKVVKITRESVELVDSGNPSNKRTLSLPNIVGYSSEKSTKTEEATSTEDISLDNPENVLQEVLKQKDTLKQKINTIPMPMPGMGIPGALKRNGLKLQQP